jgi:hypothetical protein
VSCRRRSFAVFAALLTWACAKAAPSRDAAPASRLASVISDVVSGYQDRLALTVDVYRPAQPNGAGIIVILSGGGQSCVAIGRHQGLEARTRGGARRRAVRAGDQDDGGDEPSVHPAALRFGPGGRLLFYIMPYVEGEPIREQLNRETQFELDEAVRIARASYLHLVPNWLDRMKTAVDAANR